MTVAVLRGLRSRLNTMDDARCLSLLPASLPMRMRWDRPAATAAPVSLIHSL